MSITVTITAEAVPSGASGNGEVSRSHCARSPPWTLRSAATIDRQRTALSTTITMIPSGYRDRTERAPWVMSTG